MPGGKIAVVQLSDDLTQGTFVTNLVSDDFAVPTTIIGFGDSIYAINTHYRELVDPDNDPTQVQSEVVRVDKDASAFLNADQATR